jgi:ParB-like chromosome segregation protein Spo0J
VTVWRGAEQLRPLLVPLSSVTQHPDNPRQGDAGTIAASLSRFGQMKPIVVQRSTGWIVAGNHTWQGATMAGELERVLDTGPGEDWTHVAAVFVDLDDLEAKAYAIADNRTSDLGTYDDDRLARILSELAEADSLVGVGYDRDDVDERLASLSPMIPTDLAPPNPAGSVGPEVLVEIRASRAFVDEVSAVLATWAGREGVEVSIS